MTILSSQCIPTFPPQHKHFDVVYYVLKAAVDNVHNLPAISIFLHYDVYLIDRVQSDCTEDIIFIYFTVLQCSK